MGWFWLSLTLGLATLELATLRLIFVWFSISGFLTTIVTASFSEISIGWQIVVFVALSLALFFSTRPLVKKIMKKNK